MRFLAHAASILVLLCSVMTVDAAPTDTVAETVANLTVTVPSTNQAVADLRPSCTRRLKYFPIWRYDWEIEIPNLPEDISIVEMCKGLWEGLYQQMACHVSSPHGCGEGTDSRTLRWHFHTAALVCTKWSVENAYWRGTQDVYGRVSCKSV